MIIYHELFPSSYLLALASSSTSTTETELAAHLARACQQRLQWRKARLVLWQVPAAVQQALRRAHAGTRGHIVIVPTLDDAAALA